MAVRLPAANSQSRARYGMAAQICNPAFAMAEASVQRNTGNHGGSTRGHPHGGGECGAEGFYQLCWHLGASQGDIAMLKGEDMDWENNTVNFTRKKTKVPVIVRLGSEALNLLRDLPAEGPLLPQLNTSLSHPSLALTQATFKFVRRRCA